MSGAVPQTRSSLIDRLRRGTGSSWEQFVGLYLPVILNWLRFRGVTGPDADDLAQRVTVRLLLGIRAYDRTKGPFRAWLRMVVENAVKDSVRRAARRPRLVSGEVLEALAAADETAELFEDVDRTDPQLAPRMEAVERVRARLHPNTWAAFALVVMEDRPIKDVAEALGTTEGNVRAIKSRVAKLIREEWLQASTGETPTA